MTRRPEPGTDPFAVPTWMDWLGGLLDRNPGLCIRLGRMETKAFAEQLEHTSLEAPIYVTGLARAGSTILLELLARHPDVATHIYRDFPPVHTPLWWNWFVERAERRPEAPAERAHLDGIEVTAASPEAFEEVVWKTFFTCLHDPAVPSVLGAETHNPAFESYYCDHIRKIMLVRGGSRYVAKNNYNVTRLTYLLKMFPAARIVLPIRHPYWHVASLMKQHALFRKVTRRSQRALRHLRRVGHYEFGLARLPINTGDTEAVEAISELWFKGFEADGWAEYWRLVYDHMAETLEANPAVREAVLVVRYEDFCKHPARTMARILDHCGLPHGELTREAERRIRHPAYYSPNYTQAERAAIESRTAATVTRFGYPNELPGD